MSTAENNRNQRTVAASGLWMTPETLRLLIRRIGEGIYITDSEGRFLDANAAFLEIFGVSSLSDLQSTRCRSFWPIPARRKEELAILAARGAFASSS